MTFGEFVSAGDLVFDVGANRGAMTQQFLALGAEVVCVEPQRQLAQQLENLHVTVCQAALGSEPGTMYLHSSNDDRFASLREDWTQGHAQLWHWDSKSVMPVSVTTLDYLIESFGYPAFVKIDTEGFEDEVIRGLSHPVPALSIEYCGRRHPLYDVHGGAAALHILDQLYDYTYRFAEHSAHWSSDWMNLDDATAYIQDADWGGVYARANYAV